MNAYSCKPSGHQSDAGMHTLMCIAILISGICGDELATTSGQLSGMGLNAILIPQISLQFLRAQGVQVCGSGNFSIPSSEN